MADKFEQAGFTKGCSSRVMASNKEGWKTRAASQAACLALGALFCVGWGVAERQIIDHSVSLACLRKANEGNLWRVVSVKHCGHGETH